MKLENTFAHFLLQHQRRHNRSLNFVILMESLMTAANYIQYYYATGALQKNLGQVGITNVQGENVMALDMMANQIVMRYLSTSEQVLEATSEEMSDEVILNEQGKYFVYFDPLDGSTNIKHSLPVGFMFGIAKVNTEGPEDFHIRRGSEFIASGMFLIPNGVFTFALKNSGTWRFIRDEAGIYIRPERVFFPEAESSWELSYNAGNLSTYSEPVQNWLQRHGPDYNYRYAGSLAVDFHRLLSTGGMFLYPAIVNHKNPGKNRPEGKLRLLYEADVVGLIAKEAGGSAIDEQGEDILEIVPKHRHQRSALYVGNTKLVSDIKEILG